MSREPIRDRLHQTLSDQLDNVVLLQLDDNCPVRLSLASAPIVDPDNADRRPGPAGGPALQLPQDRIVAGRDRKTSASISPDRPPAV